MIKNTKNKSTILAYIFLVILEVGLFCIILFQFYCELGGMIYSEKYNAIGTGIMTEENFDIMYSLPLTKKSIKEYVKEEYGDNAIVLNWMPKINYNINSLFLEGYYFEVYAGGEIFWVGMNEYNVSENNYDEVWLFDSKKNGDIKDEMKQ